MPGRRKTAMDIRELLLHLRAQPSDRAVQRDTGMHRQTVKHYRDWAQEHGLLTGPLPPQAELAQVVAACTQPATEGLQVATQAPQAVALRRLMLEFLLARCPSSGTLRDLAADAGVTATRFASAASRGRPDELCILCGLCVRVCRDLVGAAAIGFSGRGAGREVDAPFHVQAEACIGCGACAAVCPTGAVQIEDVGGQRFLRTWHTVVPLRPCPGCGQPCSPEPMAFLAGLADASAHLWGLCPACRRKAATQAVSAAQPR